MGDDLAAQLLDDLGDISSEEEVEEDVDALVHDSVNTEKPKQPFLVRVQDIIDHGGGTTVDPNDPASMLKVLPLVPELKEQFEKYSTEEAMELEHLMAAVNAPDGPEFHFINTINDFSQVITAEIQVLDLWIRTQYGHIFAELDSLVRDAPSYARIVLMVQDDVKGIRSLEDQLKEVVAPEKVMVIILAASTQKETGELTQRELNRVCDACDALLKLDDTLFAISQFVGQRIVKFAPNVNAILGSITTSQLIIAAGSLAQLAATPSCNVPSMGVKQMATSGGQNLVRQRGFLYYNDLVQGLPADVIRLAMRIIAGKTVLAARIDHLRSSPEGGLGLKFRTEIIEKIDKLLAPPEATPDKALPVPIEKKLRKRGGRKYRKMRERLKMSEMRKAQNMMEFGKPEDTVLDAYGEEVGLGMAAKLRAIANSATSAKMSKGMAARVARVSKP